MISIIVPVYNLKALLPRCIESLIAQTYEDYEIILVDDGSTDGSAELCDYYAEMYKDKIRSVHKKNGGLSSARNVGINEAQGEYIIFPDPDDWVEEDYLAVFIEMYTNNNIQLACASYWVTYDTKEIEPEKQKISGILDGIQAQHLLIIPSGIGGFAWNKLYLADIIKKNKLQFLDDVGTTEDLDFAYRYLNYCQTVCYSSINKTYHYYQREGAATHSSFNVHKFESLHTYEKIIQNAVDKGIIKDAQIELCSTALNLIYILLTDETIDKREKSNYRKILRSIMTKNIKPLMSSTNYSAGRKLQAVIAAISPGIYCWVKNIKRGA